MRLVTSRVRRIVGEFRPPGDKSLTHRAALLAGIARTPSRISGPLLGEDCRATFGALRALGVTVSLGDDLEIVPAEWRSPEGDVDCGNSGTTARLLSGLLASRAGLGARLVGDASLSRRPMRRIGDPLRAMGADLSGDTLPLTVRGRDLRGIAYESPVASAQVKSAILLAGLRAEGATSVTEPTLSRDHTERMLRALGVPIVSEGTTATLAGASRSNGFDGFEFEVPGDVSSATFLLVAAAMLPGSELTVRDLALNPTRTGVLESLAAAGAPVSVRAGGERLGEPVGDLTMVGPKALGAFEIMPSQVPSLVDEIPVLAVLATQCQGMSDFGGLSELRVKESDRLAVMAEGLNRMGARVEERADGLTIHGPTPLTGATVDARGDHRIAMAFAVAGLVAEGETTIEGAEAIETSFPDFEDTLRELCEI